MYRAGDLIDPTILSRKKAAVLGLGSVGGHAAQWMPPDLAEITLVDNNSLSVENVERHLLGKAYIGQPKVNGVRQHLIEHYGRNPDSIVAIQERGENILDELEHVDVVIEATNDPLLRYALNIWALNCNKPVVYVGVYAGGSGWQTVTLTNPSDLCYQCVELLRVNEDSAREELPDYCNTPGPVIDQLHAAIGLVSSVAPAAAMAAKLATDILMGRPVESPIHRCTYQPKPIMYLHDETSTKVAQLMIKLQQQLGLDQYELIASEEGFTLQQKLGSIPLIIRQAPGCWLHQAPKRRRRR